MKIRRPLILLLTLACFASRPGWCQDLPGSPGEQDNTARNGTVKSSKDSTKNKKQRSAGREIAGGTGNIASGAAKGAGHAAAGVGKGAADLATLHPVGAAVDLGKGGAYAGKSVAVGTTKGTAKIAKGIGKGLRHLF